MIKLLAFLFLFGVPVIAGRLFGYHHSYGIETSIVVTLGIFFLAFLAALFLVARGRANIAVIFTALISLFAFDIDSAELQYSIFLSLLFWIGNLSIIFLFISYFYAYFFSGVSVLILLIYPTIQRVINSKYKVFLFLLLLIVFFLFLKNLEFTDRIVSDLLNNGRVIEFEHFYNSLPRILNDRVEQVVPLLSESTFHSVFFDLVHGYSYTGILFSGMLILYFLSMLKLHIAFLSIFFLAISPILSSGNLLFLIYLFINSLLFFNNFSQSKK